MKRRASEAERGVCKGFRYLVSDAFCELLPDPVTGYVWVRRKSFLPRASPETVRRRVRAGVHRSPTLGRALHPKEAEPDREGASGEGSPSLPGQDCSSPSSAPPKEVMPSSALLPEPGCICAIPEPGVHLLDPKGVLQPEDAFSWGTLRIGNSQVLRVSCLGRPD